MLKLTLAASLLINGLLFWRLCSGHPRVESASNRTDVISATEPGRALLRREPAIVPAAFSWWSLESTNYFRYIQNLRSIQCPERTIANIIAGEIDAIYAEERLRLLSNAKRLFWETLARTGQPLDEQARAQCEALRSERDELVKALLGSSESLNHSREDLSMVFSEMRKVKQVEFLFGHLDDEKQIACWRALGTPGILALLSSNENSPGWEELQRILSPDELDEVRLRLTPIAQEFASTSQLNISEEQGRKIAELQLSFLQRGLGFNQMNPQPSPQNDPPKRTRRRNPGRPWRLWLPAISGPQRPDLSTHRRFCC
jgi:hypothetical protein